MEPVCVHEIGRPSLEGVLVGAEKHSFRNKVVHKVCHEYGYTQAEVAAAIDLNCSAISKINRRMGLFKIQDLTLASACILFFLVFWVPS